MIHQAEAIVVGGGISGLVAAWELAKQGLEKIVVLEADQHFGGCVTSHTVAGIEMDAGAESFATRSAVIPRLLEELGIAERKVEPNAAGAWLYLPTGPIPMPKTGILGIPGDLDTPELEQILSPAGLARAKEDLIKPVTKWGKRLAHPDGTQISVAELVLERMGQEVLELLVTPVVSGVHSADPATLDLQTVAPGLVEAMISTGSLSSGVAQQRHNAAAAISHKNERHTDKSKNSKPGAAVAGLAGGMNQLTSHLVAALRQRGVELITGARVDSVELKSHQGAEEYLVRTGPATYAAPQLVVATDGSAAVDLLSSLHEGLAQYRPPAGAGVALVTLVVDHPDLDSAPRGTGVLVSPLVKHIQAKALTHASAKWQWIKQELGQQAPHRHVLRLSYGRISDTVEQLGYSSAAADLCRVAIADASAILGVDFSEADVQDKDVVRWLGALPFATLGHQQRVAAFRQEISSLPRLSAVGAWLSGTGLVAVISDTQKILNSAR